MPADAPFHFPDPALPLSWPLAYAPLIETFTSPPLPMVPETLAPGAVILPSATVNMELAVGSQVPVLVTMVTCQLPSYGVWATAGAASAAVITEAAQNAAMRSKRMNSVLEYV